MLSPIYAIFKHAKTSSLYKTPEDFVEPVCLAQPVERQTLVSPLTLWKNDFVEVACS